MAELPDLKDVANLGLTGIGLAVAISVLLWPPRPVDTIPVVTVPPDLLDRLSITTRLLEPAVPLRGLLVSRFKPFCNVDEYRVADLPYFNATHKIQAQDLQLFLEEQKESFAICIAAKKEFSGLDDSQNQAAARDLAALEKSRDEADESLATSRAKNSESPVLPQAAQRAARLREEINAVRSQIYYREQDARTREGEIAELTRYSGWLDTRLQDPDRLRPERSLTDFLKGLSDHLSAFTALAAGLGTLVKVILSPSGAASTYNSVYRGNE